MINILGTTLSFFIVIGILVFIHEFGHFFMGKLAGIRVEIFSFGFGKRLFGFKKGYTDYRVSVVPIGGYVKFLGEGGSEPGRVLEPDDFMAKSRWRRFFVMVMGSIMNILLAVALYTIVNMAGMLVPEYTTERPVIGWIESGSPAEKAGLQVDDEILGINRKPVATWGDVEFVVGSKPNRILALDIKRNGAVIPVQLQTEKDKQSPYDIGYAGFYGKILTQVKTVTAGSPAEKGGLKPGDVILAIDGDPAYFYKFVGMIEKNPDTMLTFSVLRDGLPRTLQITPRREGNVGKIGIRQDVKSIEKAFGPAAALRESFKECSRTAFALIDLVKNLIIGRASAARSLGGPLEIAKMSYSFFQMGFVRLLWFIAFISLQLGILNLLPIPFLPLDGTQIFILGLEGVLRRDLNAKLKQIWTQVMFIAFMALFVFLVANDIVRSLPNGWKSLLPFAK